jgi:hypothetical protein
LEDFSIEEVTVDPPDSSSVSSDGTTLQISTLVADIQISDSIKRFRLGVDHGFGGKICVTRGPQTLVVVVGEEHLCL